MEKKSGDDYGRCMALAHKLIGEWEKMRPDEELVIMVLPKCDQKARRERLEEISRMLLKEEW